MTIDMVLNLCFVFLIGNLFGVLAASNIGYVLAHFFAITGFILLRRDRPNWPRPDGSGAVWVPIAYVLAAIVAVFTVIGVGWFQTSAGGYGGTKEKVIGFSVLAISIVLFFYRRLVQDRQPVRLREDAPSMPDARQQALIDEAARPVA